MKKVKVNKKMAYIGSLGAVAIGTVAAIAIPMALRESKENTVIDYNSQIQAIASAKTKPASEAAAFKFFGLERKTTTQINALTAVDEKAKYDAAVNLAAIIQAKSGPATAAKEIITVEETKDASTGLKQVLVIFSSKATVRPAKTAATRLTFAAADTYAALTTLSASGKVIRLENKHGAYATSLKTPTFETHEYDLILLFKTFEKAVDDKTTPFNAATLGTYNYKKDLDSVAKQELVTWLFKHKRSGTTLAKTDISPLVTFKKGTSPAPSGKADGKGTLTFDLSKGNFGSYSKSVTITDYVNRDGYPVSLRQSGQGKVADDIKLTDIDQTSLTMKGKNGNTLSVTGVAVTTGVTDGSSVTVTFSDGETLVLKTTSYAQKAISYLKYKTLAKKDLTTPNYGTLASAYAKASAKTNELKAWTDLIDADTSLSATSKVKALATVAGVSLIADDATGTLKVKFTAGSETITLEVKDGVNTKLFQTTAEKRTADIQAAANKITLSKVQGAIALILPKDSTKDADKVTFPSTVTVTENGLTFTLTLTGTPNKNAGNIAFTFTVTGPDGKAITISITSGIYGGFKTYATPAQMKADIDNWLGKTVTFTSPDAKHDPKALEKDNATVKQLFETWLTNTPANKTHGANPVISNIKKSASGAITFTVTFTIPNGTGTALTSTGTVTMTGLKSDADIANDKLNTFKKGDLKAPTAKVVKSFQSNQAQGDFNHPTLAGFTITFKNATKSDVQGMSTVTYDISVPNTTAKKTVTFSVKASKSQADLEKEVRDAVAGLTATSFTTVWPKLGRAANETKDSVAGKQAKVLKIVQDAITDTDAKALLTSGLVTLGQGNGTMNVFVDLSGLGGSKQTFAITGFKQATGPNVLLADAAIAKSKTAFNSLKNATGGTTTSVTGNAKKLPSELKSATTAAALGFVEPAKASIAGNWNATAAIKGGPSKTTSFSYKVKSSDDATGTMVIEATIELTPGISVTVDFKLKGFQTTTQRAIEDADKEIDAAKKLATAPTLKTAAAVKTANAAIASDFTAPAGTGTLTFTVKSVAKSKTEPSGATAAVTMEIKSSVQGSKTETYVVDVAGFKTELALAKEAADKEIDDAKTTATKPTLKSGSAAKTAQDVQSGDLTAPAGTGTLTFNVTAVTKSTTTTDGTTVTATIGIVSSVPGAKTGETYQVELGGFTSEADKAKQEGQAKVDDIATNKTNVTAPNQTGTTVQKGATPTATSVNAPTHSDVNFTFKSATAVTGGSSTFTYEVELKVAVAGVTKKQVTFVVTGFESDADAAKRLAQAKIDGVAKGNLTIPAASSTVLPSTVTKPTHPDVNGTKVAFTTWTHDDANGKITWVATVSLAPGTSKTLTGTITGYQTTAGAGAAADQTAVNGVGVGDLTIPSSSSTALPSTVTKPTTHPDVNGTKVAFTTWTQNDTTGEITWAATVTKGAATKTLTGKITGYQTTAGAGALADQTAVNGVGVGDLTIPSSSNTALPSTVAKPTTHPDVNGTKVAFTTWTHDDGKGEISWAATVTKGAATKTLTGKITGYQTTAQKTAAADQATVNGVVVGDINLPKASKTALPSTVSQPGNQTAKTTTVSFTTWTHDDGKGEISWTATVTKGAATKTLTGKITGYQTTAGAGAAADQTAVNGVVVGDIKLPTGASTKQATTETQPADQTVNGTTVSFKTWTQNDTTGEITWVASVTKGAATKDINGKITGYQTTAQKATADAQTALNAEQARVNGLKSAGAVTTEVKDSIKPANTPLTAALATAAGVTANLDTAKFTYTYEGTAGGIKVTVKSKTHGSLAATPAPALIAVTWKPNPVAPVTPPATVKPQDTLSDAIKTALGAGLTGAALPAKKTETPAVAAAAIKTVADIKTYTGKDLSAIAGIAAGAKVSAKVGAKAKTVDIEIAIAGATGAKAKLTFVLTGLK